MIMKSSQEFIYLHFLKGARLKSCPKHNGNKERKNVVKDSTKCVKMSFVRLII